jgi:DNA-binding winged helix-turn-helix (wHTH) protein/TolB-like protein/Flp pilus assembly protein TadD
MRSGIDVSLPQQHCYEFGPFRLDAAEGQLLCAGREIPLTPKAFQLLQALVQNSGHVLDKDALIARVWADSFVEEKNLADNISILRKALGDDPKEPRYIKTVPRRGYRFVAEVREIVEDGQELLLRERERARFVIEEHDLEEEHELSPAQARALEATPRESLPATNLLRRWIRPALVVVALALTTGLTLGAYTFWKNRRGGSAPLARSIAVLPFKPLLGGSADPALELGITDALITKLSNIRQVVVRPTNSVLKYSVEGQDLRVAGSELDVDMLLDGKVQRLGDRIRLSVQLVRASDGTPVWAEKFDEKFTDIFAVQDSISEKVASALALKLSGEERRGLSKRYTDNVEAYQLYLQGRYHWRKFKQDDLLTSINYFNAALKIDPNYALAYAGLANSYNVINIWGPLPAEEVLPKAREAAQKAVDLDPDLAPARVALGANKLFAWDWDGARRELERAIELDPTMDGYAPYGYYLHAMGRTEEALVQLRRVKALAPEWQIASNDVLWGLFYARHYDETIAESRQAIGLDPNEFGSYYLLGQAYAQKGRYSEAIASLEQGYEVASPDQKPRLLAERGYVSALTGDKAKAAEAIGRLKEKPIRLTPFLIAEIYAGLGDKDRTFVWLNKACDELVPFLWEVRVMPQFDSIRSDPRYAALLQRMNLSP